MQMATEWTKQRIIELLETNDAAVGRALARLHENQTFDEQTHKDVKYRNNVGFRPCDAHVGSGMAEFFKKRGFLTEKQLAYWRSRNAKGTMRIGVYANQLLKQIK
jgi:hypothetical protein